MEEVLLSVVMTTYNHERYIATAIESVLRQQTLFRVEIVVGEDCSTDRTRAIVEDYQRMYPECVHIVTSTENVGWRKNYRRTIEAASGKYIAFSSSDSPETARGKALEANEATAPCVSLLCIGFAPGAIGTPVFLPSGVFPVFLP